MVTAAESDFSQPLITFTSTGSNKSNEYDLVSQVLDIKINLNGNNFRDFFETFATYAYTKSMNILFECGHGTTCISLVHTNYSVKSPSLITIVLFLWIMRKCWQNLSAQK